jgi:tripartite ATP-independent transporter DctP family solute receptor
MNSILKAMLTGLTVISMSIMFAGAASAKDKPVILKFASNFKTADFTNDNPGAYAIKVFMKEIETKTNGRLKVKLFPDAMLASKGEEIVTGLQTGAFDFTNLALGSWGDYTKAFMPFNMPYLFFDSKIVYDFLDGKMGEEMRKQLLADTGVMNISWLDIGFRQVTNNVRQVKNPSDMVGLKMRTMADPFQIKAMKALGASVIALPYSELFTALQQGVVDGEENPIANIYTAKFYEVQKYLTLTGHIYSLTSINVSKKKFDSFSSEDQKIILEAGRNATLASRKKLAEKESEMFNQLKKTMEIYKPTKEELKQFQSKTKSVWIDAEKEIGSEYYNEIINEVSNIQKKHGFE